VDNAIVLRVRCGAWLTGYALASGHTTSCGCFHRECMRKHGHGTKEARSPTYNCWADMLHRAVVRIILVPIVILNAVSRSVNIGKTLRTF
jgi:hypothetical protein